MNEPLGNMEEFKKDSIKIRDKQNVEIKLKNIIKGGSEKLQVIMDFDATITRYSLNGERCESTHGIVEKSNLMPEEIKLALKALFEKYYPIEISGKLTIEEKIPHLIKWYEEAHKHFMKTDIHKKDIQNMVAKSNVPLREECKAVFKLLNKLNVPLLIFSAGIGDVVEEILRFNDCFYENMKVISNFMDFDENGKLRGFKNDPIHVFNKDETVLMEHSEYFDKLADKQNILLLGDSLGDLNMCRGHKNAKTVLKIGFLNCQIQDNMEQYLLGYDIVLVSDETMELLLGITKRLHSYE